MSSLHAASYRGRLLRFVQHAAAIYVAREDLLDILALGVPQPLRAALLAPATVPDIDINIGAEAEANASATPRVERRLGAVLGPGEIGPAIHTRVGFAMIHRLATLAGPPAGATLAAHAAVARHAEAVLDWYAEVVFAACDAFRLDPRTVQSFLWHAPPLAHPLCPVRVSPGEGGDGYSAVCQELGLRVTAPDLSSLVERVLAGVPAAVERRQPGACADDVRLVFSLAHERLS